MSQSLTATQIFLRALKETGEYHNVINAIHTANKKKIHIGYNWKKINFHSPTFVEDIMLSNYCNLLGVIDYIRLGFMYRNDYNNFQTTTKKIHKWIIKNVNGNYLKRLVSKASSEIDWDGERLGYHDLKFSWKE